MLENVRFLTGEKADAEDLARRLAALCDIYVMDAFATAHRAQASTHSVARFAPVACAGPLLAGELAGQGILVPAIRPPTVPAGTSRLRVTVSAAHCDADLDRLLEALHGAGIDV